MTDTSVAPSSPEMTVNPPLNPLPELTDEQKAEADKLFEALEKEAELQMRGYVVARVPMALHAYYRETHPMEDPAPTAAPAPGYPTAV